MDIQFSFGPNRSYFCSAGVYFAWSDGNLPIALRRILDDKRHPQAMQMPYDVAFPMEPGTYAMCWRTTRGENCYEDSRMSTHYARLARFIKNTHAHAKPTSRTVFGPNASFFSMSERGFAWERLPPALEEDLQTCLRVRRPVCVALGVQGAYVVLYNDGTVTFDLRGAYPLVERLIRNTGEAAAKRGITYIALNPFVPNEFYAVYGDASASWNFPTNWTADVTTVSREIKPVGVSSAPPPPPPRPQAQTQFGGATPSQFGGTGPASPAVQTMHNQPGRPPRPMSVSTTASFASSPSTPPAAIVAAPTPVHAVHPPPPNPTASPAPSTISAHSMSSLPTHMPSSSSGGTGPSVMQLAANTSMPPSNAFSSVVSQAGTPFSQNTSATANDAPPPAYAPLVGVPPSSGSNPSSMPSTPPVAMFPSAITQPVPQQTTGTFGSPNYVPPSHSSPPAPPGELVNSSTTSSTPTSSLSSTNLASVDSIVSQQPGLPITSPAPGPSGLSQVLASPSPSLSMGGLPATPAVDFASTSNAAPLLSQGGVSAATTSPSGPRPTWTIASTCFANALTPSGAINQSATPSPPPAKPNSDTFSNASNTQMLSSGGTTPAAFPQQTQMEYSLASTASGGTGPTLLSDTLSGGTIPSTSGGTIPTTSGGTIPTTSGGTVPMTLPGEAAPRPQIYHSNSSPLPQQGPHPTTHHAYTMPPPPPQHPSASGPRPPAQTQVPSSPQSPLNLPKIDWKSGLSLGLKAASGLNKLANMFDPQPQQPDATGAILNIASAALDNHQNQHQNPQQSQQLQQLQQLAQLQQQLAQQQQTQQTQDVQLQLQQLQQLQLLQQQLQAQQNQNNAFDTNALYNLAALSNLASGVGGNNDQVFLQETETINIFDNGNGGTTVVDTTSWQMTECWYVLRSCLSLVVDLSSRTRFFLIRGTASVAMVRATFA
ncbi:hypothetical protein MKEN_01481900 [Mycena kentingensis (nom. inval.)]|nr:hypothetical protein MKEN_01481900 [Mycena kentingensis (nom. inval.)]